MDAAAVIGGPCTGKRRRKSREPSVASVQYHGRREPPRFFFLDPSSIRGNDKSGWKPARNLGNAVVARRPKGQDDSATAAWPRAVLLPKFVSQSRSERWTHRSSRIATSKIHALILHTSSVRKLVSGIYSSAFFSFLSCRIATIIYESRLD